MTRLFLRELRAYRNGLFFWSLGMFALIVSGMAKYGAFQSTGQSINIVISQFPKSIQIIFGISGFDLTKASGFYGILFIYIALMATVHALLLGTDIIAKEERDKTSEFLFVKPISRDNIISAKLLAGLFNIIILNVVTFISSIYAVAYFNKNSSADHNIAVLIMGLFFMQLIFFFVGSAIAAASKNPKASASIGASVLLVTFILPFFINFNDSLDSLKYLTPFKYFDTKTVMAAGHLDIAYVIISLALILAAIVSTYTAYTKRDVAI